MKHFAAVLFNFSLVGNTPILPFGMALHKVVAVRVSEYLFVLGGITKVEVKYCFSGVSGDIFPRIKLLWYLRLY